MLGVEPRGTARGTHHVDVLACPACRGKLAREAKALVCRGCEARFKIENGIPKLRAELDAPSEEVRAFYTIAPFPGYPPTESLSSLRRKAERSDLARLLDHAIPGDATVVELGCGTGQMSLFLARADRRVFACDMTRASLELGREAATRFGVSQIQFVETDLRSPGLREKAFDVVYTSGVLHHTEDPRASFRTVAKLVKPGGIVVVGLYNAYARFPHRLRRLVARITKNRFIPFDPVLRDRAAEPARREAWLRDQYMHPLEHRHTIAEVQRWFRENGIDYVRSFPNTLIGAEPLQDDELFVPAEDNWGFENVLAQMGWAVTTSHEGGLFVVIGRAAKV